MSIYIYIHICIYMSIYIYIYIGCPQSSLTSTYTSLLHYLSIACKCAYIHILPSHYPLIIPLYKLYIPIIYIYTFIIHPSYTHDHHRSLITPLQTRVRRPGWSLIGSCWHLPAWGFKNEATGTGNEHDMWKYI